MKRTTVFFEPEVLELLFKAVEEEKRRRKQKVTLSQLIREAVEHYLVEHGYLPERREEKIRRALLTHGALGEDFERRAQEVRRKFDQWDLESVWTPTSS